MYRARLILFLTVLISGTCSAQTLQEFSSYFDEAYAREHAVTSALPVYPQELVQLRLDDVVETKIAINDRGEVVKIKIHPRVHPALKRAVADAADKWRFELGAHAFVNGPYSMSHLTFQFSVINGVPIVQLFQPPPGATDPVHLGYLNTQKEAKEWMKWEEVQPSRKATGDQMTSPAF